MYCGLLCLKVHCRIFFLIFILIVLCETSSMIPISVCSASRWRSYEGTKLQKDQLCVGVSGFSVAAMLKRRDVIVGSGMFAQVWRRVGQATD